MAKFIRLVMQEGEFPVDYLDQPEPDPAMFGMSADDDGRRDDPLLGQDPGSTTIYQPDFEALAAASTRIVLAAGVESASQMTGRAGGCCRCAPQSGPDRVPQPPRGLPRWEYGQRGDPDAFGARLREVVGY